MIIPFSPPDISEDEIIEMVNTLKSGWITTGPKTKQFEKDIQEYTTASKAVTMSSSTAAMEMTLRLLEIGPGDEVITSAYTFSASASVIHHVGAKIVLVDTGKDSFQMDLDQLRKAITSKTKAIIPVDFAGVLCEYDKIFEILEEEKKLFCPANEIQKEFGRVIVIGDGSHSFGGEYKGKRSGAVADFTCFSFHAVKNLTTAEGGAVVWKEVPGFYSEDIYKEFMLLSLHGQSKDALAKTQVGAWEYDILKPGYKCNMTDLSASLGLVQLRRYPKLLKRRKEIIGLYDQAMNRCNVSYLKHQGEEYSSSGHLYVVRLTGKKETYRNGIVEKMAQKGVAVNVHYKPLPMLTAYQNLGFHIRDYPNSYHMYENEITLPLHTLLTDEQVQYVTNQFHKILES